MKIAVYSPNWIGDSVLALPFIRCLKSSYPNAEIYIFCKEWVSGIYENNPNISNIFYFKNEVLKSFKGTIKAGLKIRKIKLGNQYFVILHKNSLQNSTIKLDNNKNEFTNRK